MDNHELKQTIESISEEAAQALIDAFERSTEATRELANKTLEMMESIAQNTVATSAWNYAKSVEKYIKATFLTRWYKKRRVEKARKKLEDTIEWYNKWHDSCKEEKS